MAKPTKQDILGGVLVVAGLALIFGPMVTNSMTVWTLVFGVILAIFGAYLMEPATSKSAIDEIGEAASPWTILKARSGRTPRRSDEEPVEVQPAPHQPVVITPPVGSVATEPITVPPAPMPGPDAPRPLPDDVAVEAGGSGSVDYEAADAIVPAEPAEVQKLVAGKRATKQPEPQTTGIDYDTLGA